jgi:hypothetical protein
MKKFKKEHAATSRKERRAPKNALFLGIIEIL